MLVFTTCFWAAGSGERALTTPDAASVSLPSLSSRSMTAWTCGLVAAGSSRKLFCASRRRRLRSVSLLFNQETLAARSASNSCPGFEVYCSGGPNTGGTLSCARTGASSNTIIAANIPAAKMCNRLLRAMVPPSVRISCRSRARRPAARGFRGTAARYQRSASRRIPEQVLDLLVHPAHDFFFAAFRLLRLGDGCDLGRCRCGCGRHHHPRRCRPGRHDGARREQRTRL